MHSSKNIFFIVGRGRSGTDLLQRLLNTNPEICIPPESSVIALLFNKYKSKTWNEKTMKSFYKDVFLDDKISNWWKISRRKFKSKLFSIYPNSFSEAIYVLYQLYAEQIGSKDVIIGDKNPANTLYIEEILQIFPNAKFIALIRNPVDNVFSFTNVSFDSNQPKVLAHRWKFYNNEIIKMKNKYPNNFHTLQFENLIGYTQGELSKIANFLGVKDDFNIENKEKGNQEWQKNLDGDISASHISKGVKGLMAEDVEYINSVTQSTANQLGYSIKNNSKGSLNLQSWFFNRFEKHFIRLPLYLSSSILKYYRKKKKIIVD